MVSKTMTPQKSARRRAVGIALALSAVFPLSSCAAAAEQPPQTQASTEAVEAPTPEAVWPDGEEQGTLANPYSIGEEITDGDWSLIIESVNLDANAEIAALDTALSKVAPDPGKTWVTFMATWTYNGTEPAEGGTQFSMVNKDWKDVDDRDNEHVSTFNDVSTLTENGTTAPPAEKGFTVTEQVIMQMPVEHANTSSMINARFNSADYNHFLIELT
jgi:hypothetical protein